MPARVPEFWERRTKSIKSNHPSWGAGRIKAALDEEAKEFRREDAPSERWVGGWLNDVWPNVTPEERAQCRTFYWPESMEQKDLPWEASAAGLQLLAFLDHHGVRGRRPPNRLVNWFWRVTEATWNASINVRLGIAVGFCRREAACQPLGDRGSEWYLAYEKVKQEERREAYEKALTREDRPVPRSWSGIAASTEDDEDFHFWMELLLSLQPHEEET